MNIPTLQEHCRKYYSRRHGPVVSMQPRKNLLGEFNFMEVTFKDGLVANFCEVVDGIRWFRNERTAKRPTTK